MSLNIFWSYSVEDGGSESEIDWKVLDRQVSTKTVADEDDDVSSKKGLRYYH